MLPLINESINSKAVVRHCLKIIIKTVHDLNPGQIAIVTADQPVFAPAKQVQWQHPSEFGEDKILVMMGDLHIEMAFMDAIADWLEGSEWEEIFVAAGVKTPGTSKTYLSGHNVKKCRYAHQVSLTALHHLLMKDWQRYLKDHQCEISLDKWIEKRRHEYAQFEYWYTVYELESLLLQFVRSIREANFFLNHDTLEQIAPWIFLLDHINYARWLSVYLQLLREMPVRHPDINMQFQRGEFVIQKGNRKFSCIGIDQAHEQNNKVVKGAGGVKGILDKPNALLKWMIAGPEMEMMVKEYEVLLGSMMTTAKRDITRI